MTDDVDGAAGEAGEAEEQPSTGLSVVLVDDSSLFRQGLAGLLTAARLQVVAELSGPERLFQVMAEFRPDVVILDVRMPPTHTDEGIRVAAELRLSWPDVGVLVLSTYTEALWANQLFATGSRGLGYLIKDRVDDVPTIVDAISRVASGGTVVDPEVVSRLLALNRRKSSLSALTEREQEVLGLMAEGLSNVGIGRSLFLSPRTVETYIAAVFGKLPLDAGDNNSNRRVLAVLAYLNALGQEPSR